MFHISITYLQYIFREPLYLYRKIVAIAKHFKYKDNIFFLEILYDISHILIYDKNIVVV